MDFITMCHVSVLATGMVGADGAGAAQPRVASPPSLIQKTLVR